MPFSFIYSLITLIRNVLYDKEVLRSLKVNAIVISVGNITWGGTGKTPLVLFLVRHFLSMKKKVTVLMRGYGYDEPGLLSGFARDVPVVVGKDRVRTAREAVGKYSTDIILLDDGFQHRRLKRDLDIVCVDATDPFGNGFVIPAGSLREGLIGLKRADIFLITRADLTEDLQALEDRLKEINPEALIARSIHRPENFYKISDNQAVAVSALNNKKIALVSGIGNPGSFEKTIINLGLKFEKHFIFRDHHWYTGKDLRRIDSYCLENKIDTIVTTEKDAVRLKAISCQLSAVSLLVMSVKLEITDNEQGFYNILSGICGG